MSYSWSAAAGDFNHDGVMDVVRQLLLADFTKSRNFLLMQPAVVACHRSDSLTTSTETVAGYFHRVRETHAQRIVEEASRAAGRNRGASQRPERSHGDAGCGRRRETPNWFTGRRAWCATPASIPPIHSACRTVHSVSEPGYSAGHGIGVGDINGDGRMDILNVYGWWEQPPAGSSARSSGHTILRPSAGIAAGSRPADA